MSEDIALQVILALLDMSTHTHMYIVAAVFFIPQIRDIFVNTGLQLDYDTFENLYQLAASRHPRGFVSVEGFRNVLDAAQATQLKKSDVL